MLRAVLQVFVRECLRFKGRYLICRGLGGILTGDVIVGFNGQPVRRANDLANALDDAKVGDRATLRIVRSEKTVCMP